MNKNAKYGNHVEPQQYAPRSYSPWNTKMWLIRTTWVFLLLFFSGGIILIDGMAGMLFKTAGIHAADTTKAAPANIQTLNKKGHKKTAIRKPVIPAPKRDYLPWWLVFTMSFGISMIISAIVQQWGWSPIFKVATFAFMIWLLFMIWAVKQVSAMTRQD